MQGWPPNKGHLKVSYKKSDNLSTIPGVEAKKQCLKILKGDIQLCFLYKSKLLLKYDVIRKLLRMSLRGHR